MPLTTLLFVALLAISIIGGLFNPLLAILGYMGHYIIGPEGQWWHAPVRPLGIRYSFTLAAVIALGIAFNYRKLRYGARLFTSHEKLVLYFLLFLWVLDLFTSATQAYTQVDHPTVKMVKVLLFCYMLTHVVTDVRSLKIMLWMLTICTLILGLQAYDAPRSAFLSGRLEGIGGADFRESNMLPAFVGAVLPIIGALFLQKAWISRIVAACAGVFAVNAIILTRSRGAFVALALGALSALMMAPREFRGRIVVCLLLAGLGGLYLTDDGFIDRMTTIRTADGEVEVSAQGRKDTWKASWALLKDHPLGVGPGNFKQYIGRYDARFEGRDAHSTFVRCWSELGIPGFIFFMTIIFSALWQNVKAVRRARALPEHLRDQIMLPAYGLSIGLIIMLGAGTFVTLLYVEMLWWWLLFPVCLHRVIDNLEKDNPGGRVGDDGKPATSLLADKLHPYWRS